MLSLTRAEALAQARRDFGTYVERILETQAVPPAYVHELGRYWDRRLAALARLGSDFPVSPDVLSAMALLARALRSPEMDSDAVVRWLDTFPDRIADLFPPSAVTFRLVDEADREEAETRIAYAAAAPAA